MGRGASGEGSRRGSRGGGGGGAGVRMQPGEGGPYLVKRQEGGEDDVMCAGKHP